MNKSSKIVSRQQIIERNLIQVESDIASLINGGVDELTRILPETHLMLAPILNIAFEIQNKIERKVLTPTKVTSSGSWNTHIFVDGCTEKFHTEKDCAYTCIHVPIQDYAINAMMNRKPAFIFQLNESQALLLPLTQPVSLMYNAQFICHRQAYYPESTHTESFVNVSSYGNKIF